MHLLAKARRSSCLDETLHVESVGTPIVWSNAMELREQLAGVAEQLANLNDLLELELAN